MNSLESIQHYFVLLFWYIGERNWTVQSTSTIVKPRKEAEDYQPGDFVIAKFQGKPYRAVIVRIEEQKEALTEDKLQFDKLLQDASLSPSQILEQMGIHAANLDTENGDATDNTGSDSCLTKKAAKRSVEKQEPKTKKSKLVGKDNNSPLDDIKMLGKQKKLASLESSKMMAMRLLKGSKTDKELPPKDSSTVNMSLTATNTTNTFSFQATGTQPLASFQQLSPIFSSNSQPHVDTISTDSIISSPSIPKSHSHSATDPISSLSSCIPHYSTSQAHESLTGSFQQQNILSSTRMHCPSQISSPTMTDNMYQHSGNLMYDWDYCGSASESIANNLTNEESKGLTPFLDCSKCTPLIQALTQRINTLEEKVESLIAANKHPNKHLTSAAYTASPIPYVAAVTYTASPSNSAMVRNTASPFTASPSNSELVAYTASPYTSSTSISAPATKTTSNWSLSSIAEQTVVNTPTCSNNDDGLASVELLPGYGVKITMPQLDACLRKSKGSGTALARLLVNVYFDEKTLASSSVRGTKSKPALDTSITTAIINYVCSTKKNCTERDIVQAINQKCADARSSFAASCKKK